MKKLFLIAMMAVMFASCASKKVQIFNNLEAVESDVESFNGGMYNVGITFYDKDDRLVKSVDVGTVATSTYSNKYEAAPNAVYFKVNWRAVAKGTPYYDILDMFVSREYTQIVDGTAVFELNGKTPVKAVK